MSALESKDPAAERAGVEGIDPSPWLARLGLGARPRALVLGASVDLRAAFTGAPILTTLIDDEAQLAQLSADDFDVVLVDAERWTAERLRAAWGHTTATLIVVEGPKATKSSAWAYGALDSVRRPIWPQDLVRRIFLLSELGRRRESQTYVETALEHAPVGLWIEDAKSDKRSIVYANAEAHAAMLTERDVTCELRTHDLRDEHGAVRYRVGVHCPRATIAPTPQFLSLVLEELPAGVLTANAEGLITFVNRAGLSTLGLDACEAKGSHMREVLHLPDELDAAPRTSFRLVRADGHELELGVTITPTPGLHPDIATFVLFRDLTPVREEELAHRRVERLAAMGTMVAGFAHEVRNPLTAMRCLIEGIQEDEGPVAEPVEAALTRVMRHIDRIERLVRTSLKFGRPETPRKRKRSAATMAQDALEQLKPRTRGKTPIELVVDADVPTVEVDEQQIVQVLVALLDNALDASGDPGKVSVSVHAADEPSGRAVHVEVEDRGPGIPEHILGRVFDPFFTTKSSGTGLGLSIAQQLVHDNGGRLEVTSRPNVGATFRVVFPGIEVRT